MKRTKLLTEGAAIAALYVVLTAISNMFGMASGIVQVRLSEVLTVLPAFTAAAVPGLTAGCFIANILCGSTALDVVFGSIATLIGAAGTYYFGRNKYLAVLFPIASNTLIVPFILKYVYAFDGAIWYFFFTVGAGELISCGVFGIILWNGIKRTRLFKR